MTTEAEVFEELKYRIEVDECGSRRYYNALGQLHRDNGPAIVFSSGSREWYRNGLRHRTDGPAFVSPIGVKEWYLHGKLHRTDGPAVIHEDGAKEWWLNDVRYSEQEYYALLTELGHTV